MVAPAQPPFYGQWRVGGSDGALVDGSRVGPFGTIEEAYGAAIAEATQMPADGFMQVVDSAGRPMTPVV